MGIRVRTTVAAHALRRLHPKPGHVESGQEHEREQRRDHEAADHRVGHRPPEDGRRDRDHPEDRGGGSEQDRAQPMLRRHDHRVPWVASVADFGLDLVDQNDRVANDHADQRNDAEYGDETHGCARYQQRRSNADDGERSSGDHEEEPLKTLQLQHEDRDHEEQHERENREHTALRLRALLDSAAGRNVVAPRELRLECVNI
jgi:hypothetical protein